ncbi:MAG: VWA domain-containing protein [Candidatus Pacebacteria bacterium]|nr:VWA domain-containing protein [Candidatus Paceibacterota bacterium]
MITNKLKNKNGGFIALTSTLILTIVLMMLMFASNTSSFFARFDSLGSEFKRISLGLSESCSNMAILKVSENYNYKLKSDPDYSDDYEGVVVEVGPDICIIKSVEEITTPSGKCATSQTEKCLEITTQAEYPLENGSWSSHKVKIVAQNPAFSPTNPPPTCSFTAYPLVITENQEVTLQWNISGNASGIYITRNIGGEETTIYNGLSSGGPILEILSENATYVAKVFGPGGETECASPQTVLVEPPLSCSETVVMLDRTNNMSLSDLEKEKEATTNLLELYKTVLPEIPKIGIGRFGGSQEETAEIQSSGELTNIYENLLLAIEEATRINSTSGTDLENILKKGDAELNSSRHTKGKDKALIIISNGKASEPTANEEQNENLAKQAAELIKSPHGVDDLPTEIFTIHYGESSGQDLLASIATDSENDFATASNTSYRPPTLYMADNGDGWSSPSGAQSNGGSYTSNNGIDRERYYNFGFSFPEGVTPTGIEVSADAWTTLFYDNFGTGGTDSTFDESPLWKEGGAGAEKKEIGIDNNTASPNGGRFANMIGSNGYICIEINSSEYKSLTLSYYWRGDTDAEASDSGIVEYATGGTCESPLGLETLQTHALNTNSNTWAEVRSLSLPEELNDDESWFLRFKTNSTETIEQFRVDGVSVNGSNESMSCELGISLSYDGGITWTSGLSDPTKSKTLTSSEATYVFGGEGDNWGYDDWKISDLDNNSFRVRTHSIDSSPLCPDNAYVHIDYLRTKVYYQGTDSIKENEDNDNFFVISDPEDMSLVFEKVGKLACPAIVSSAPLPPPPPPPLPPPPPQIEIGSWDEVIDILE